MTGIMAAVAGNSQNIIYVSGLWVVETNTVQQSPITDSRTTSSAIPSITITRNWIGYFLSPVSGTVQLGMQTTNSAGTGGGTASTTGRLWLGSNAVAGDNAQANTTASGNQIIDTSFNLTQGIYYPLRIRWNGSYVGGSVFGSHRSSSGSITFRVSGATNASGTIFYNSLNNGF
jgi:hypothetical protein